MWRDCVPAPAAIRCRSLEFKPHPQPARFRGRFGIDADVAIVLSVGRASRAERYIGLYRAIDVAAELLGRGQRFAWVVVGGGAVKIPVNQKYALKDAAKAHRDLESRGTTGSSILIP